MRFDSLTDDQVLDALRQLVRRAIRRATALDWGKLGALASLSMLSEDNSFGMVDELTEDTRRSDTYSLLFEDPQYDALTFECFKRKLGTKVVDEELAVFDRSL